MKKHSWILLLIILIIPIACKLPGINTQELDKRPTETANLKTLDQDLGSNLQNLPAGSAFQIEITEGQLTAFVENKLKDNSVYPVHDLQITLQDNQITFIGKVDQAGLTMDLQLILKPNLENNQLLFDVVESKIGPFNIPQSMVETIQQELKDRFQEQLVDLGNNYQIENIEIANGVMIIKGHKISE
ncbi:MAG: hypothetical protein ACPL3P_03200 [Anaerolineales bacterium]